LKTGIFFHESFLSHDTGDSHPENFNRLNAIMDKINLFDNKKINIFECPYVNFEQLNRVHSRSYIQKIINYFPLKKNINLDNDTIISAGSVEAILRAPGSVIAAIRKVATNQLENAFCIVRPPGHHAQISSSMGFCIFNNIAIGAAYAREELLIKNIAIVDIDVHHGNGTEDWVRDNQGYLFFSIHQSPLFPGTDHSSKEENSHIINCTLSPGSSSNEFKEKLEKNLFPSIYQFQPDLILLSIGFDAHELDTISEVNLSSMDYYWITKKLCEIANDCCGGKLVSVLEGGYNLNGLADSAFNHVAALVKHDIIAG